MCSFRSRCEKKGGEKAADGSEKRERTNFPLSRLGKNGSRKRTMNEGGCGLRAKRRSRETQISREIFEIHLHVEPHWSFLIRRPS